MGSAPVAVVIPSWNCMDDLRSCIESVRAQSGVEPELLVVDNGSEDGTVPFLERERLPHVALSANLGFSAAVNLGVSRTGAPFVTVLNADAVLEPDCLERGFSAPPGRERPARRPQPARHPGQVHARPLDPEDRGGRGGRARPSARPER